MSNYAIFRGELMKLDNIGGCGSVNEFVDRKLERYKSSKRDFEAMFELMFSERENIMYERSQGYRLIKTTYGEAYDEILRRAETLSAMLRQLEPDTAVGIYMQNSLDWIEIFWAVLCCGFRPLLMNMRLDDKSLEYALGVCRAGAVISDGRSFSVPTIQAEEIIPSDSSYSPKLFGSEIFIMSSGTSRHVKICAYSAEEFYHQICGSYSIIRSCAQVKKHYDGQLKLLTFLPFYHIFGLVAVYIWFAFFSRTFVQLNDFQSQTVQNTIKRHKVTHIFAVPLFWETVYNSALRAVRERGEDTVKKLEKGLKLSRKIGDLPILGNAFTRLAFREVREEMFGESVIFMITGGSFISPEVIEFFNAIGYHLADGYGMTEIGITSVELSMKKKQRNTCSVGMPMAGVEYKINEAGELLVKGKAMAKYIIEDGQRRSNSDWFNTHDLAEKDGRGYKILGRRDDLIVAANGENLNPNLIESKLSLDGVRGVCLIAGEKDGKVQPTLLVSVNPYISSDRLASISKALRERLSNLNLSGQIGKTVFIEDGLMKDDEFKLNRARLSEDYSEGRLTEAKPDREAKAGENDEISRFITALFAHSLGISEEDVGYTADFFLDLGGTSLDYFAIIAQLRERYQVPLPADGAAMSTVEELRNKIISINNGNAE